MKRIHVVAAVIEGSAKGPEQPRVLLAKRPTHLHQGGKWEFPGGKVEAAELAVAALRRELKEELDIEVEQAEPLIKISHDYTDKNVLLDVWRVKAFSGVPRGCEGQEIRWVNKEDLPGYDFPAANVPIVTAAQLPRNYVISPEIGSSLENFLKQLTATVEAGAELIQLRVKTATLSQWDSIEQLMLELKSHYPVQVLLNSDMEFADATKFDGMHLSSRALMSIQDRPSGLRWLSASCHNAEQLAKAQQLGVDFVTLSPVYPTSSHPHSPTLGEAEFSRLVTLSTLPVFALGGMRQQHLDWCIATGAQGIAAISSLWSASV